MFFKKKLFSTIKPFFDSKTTVKFDQDIEFTITPECASDESYIFHLDHQKGDFEVIQIFVKCSNIFNTKITRELFYDKERKNFKFRNYHYYCNLAFEFVILANIEYKKVNYIEDFYSLHFPSKRLKLLDLYECEEVEIVLPKHSHLFFFCYFKKHENGAVEVHIVNPHEGVKIEGKKGDFIYETHEDQNIDLRLSFLFDSSTLLNNDEEFEAVDSRPESVMRTPKQRRQKWLN
uniref:Uncharacterized protein n=1 Tax=Panagrolaimus sp. ES5 TaxID=591445 RepID=A0AC34F3I0_9BILA